MKKFILFFLVVSFLSTNVNLFAQVASVYTFSQSLGTYNSIAGDSIVDIATHTSIDPFQLNDVTYGPNHIPFVFKYNGVNYSSFMINSNGFITFGATAPVLANYGPISSSESYKGAISAFGQNLIGVFGTTVNFNSTTFILTNVANFKGVVVGRMITAGTGIKADTYITAFDTTAKTITISKPTDDIVAVGLVVQIAAGSIVRSTSGTAPFRVHTIQFKNFRQYLLIGINDNFNFQIKLFETTGAIHIVYGDMDKLVTSSVFAQVGLRGSVNTDFNNRTNSVTLNWTTSTVGATNAASSLLSSILFPVSGTTYIWTPDQTLNTNIKVIPEGFYCTCSGGKLNIKDTVRAYLHSNIFPYNVIDSAVAVIDSITYQGSFKFYNAPIGTYYIVIRHRNTIETWSKTGGELFSLGTAINYDFTNLITKAFGSNMKQVDTSPFKFGIFSGDVNQDGTIDASDIVEIFNDLNNSTSGYVNTDLTGDDFVDATDLIIAFNNSNNIVSVISP